MLNYKFTCYIWIIILNQITKNCSKTAFNEDFLCYSCVTMLPKETDVNVKLLAKKFFAENFKLPSVNEYCINPKSFEFISVDKLTCSNNVCTKITVLYGDDMFIIRGCKSMLLNAQSNSGQKNGSSILDNSECQLGQSPQYCDCNNSLCNQADSFPIKVYVFFALLIILPLMNIE
uniref:Protein sleepless n=1 Tax=Romanomermis culicivorax TaxID=13658 RepID=A0A915L022_ROMCU